MEPVSLSLGVIPLLGGSIKLYRASQSRLRTFRHYSREVDRVRKEFERQRQFFVNEVHLSLRLVIEDESLVQEMVDDGNHLQWRSRSLERTMSDRFDANNCQVLNEIVDDIGKTISAVKDGLECFDCLEDARREVRLFSQLSNLGSLAIVNRAPSHMLIHLSQGEPIKDAVKRLQGRIRIAFDKSKFTEWISELRKSNNDLKFLREQASELGRPRKVAATRANVSNTTIRSATRRRLPSEFSSYSATRRASQALYDALWAAWSTQDAAHFRHLVKLFLETRSDEGVYLSLVISCLRQDLTQPLSFNNMIKVHVKSQSLDWLTDLPARPTADPTLTPELPNKKRRRIVRFADDEDGTYNADEASECLTHDGSAAQTPLAALDLRCSQHLCSELLLKKNPPEEQQPQQPRSPSPIAAAAVGYLDTCSQDRFRHSFFHCCEGLCDPVLCGNGGGGGSGPSTTNSLVTEQQHPPEPIRLDQLLAQPRRSDELSVPDQLQLALRIASAVLKFSSTAWLGEDWGLRDLYYFERPAEAAAAADLPASLQTLHLGVEWTRGGCGGGGGGATLMDVDGIDSPSLSSSPSGLAAALEEAKLIHGIHNVTMYNLGVALLSIGRWTAVDPHDVVHVRRMALQASPLGPRFQEMTQKVLECDFGYGKDLRKPKLQEAVYDGVLLELESMISALSFVDK